MLTKSQRTLLTNVFDALDRLFDRDSTVWDVYAILYATSEALAETPFQSAFETPIRGLAETIRSNAPRESQRDAAMLITDDLRLLLASVLRQDSTENPKRRHTK